MQTQSTEPMRLRLRPVLRLRWLNGAVHVGVLLLFVLQLPSLAWSLTWLTLVAGLVLVVGLALSCWQVDAQLALRRPTAIRYVHFDADGWAIGIDEASMQPIELRAGTVATAYTVVLCWRTQNQRQGKLLLSPESLGEDDYRRLCRQLWQQPAARSK